MEVWGLATQNDLIGQGMTITIGLLRHAEMTNYAMIMVWIVLLNPELLMWNELTKYIPYLNAANSKYRSMGEMAPWGKLILPQNEVAEVTTDKLRLLFTVPKAIA